MFASAHSEHLVGGHSRSVSLISNMICSCICPHRLDGCYWFGYDAAVSAAAVSAAAVSPLPVSAAAVSAAGWCSVDSSFVALPSNEPTGIPRNLYVPSTLYVSSPPPFSRLLLPAMLSLENLLSRLDVTEASLFACRQDGWLVWRLL